MAQPLILLSPAEQQLRLSRLTSLMKQAKADAMLITDNANLYYMTGRVFAGLWSVHRGDRRQRDLYPQARADDRAYHLRPRLTGPGTRYHRLFHHRTHQSHIPGGRNDQRLAYNP